MVARPVYTIEELPVPPTSAPRTLPAKGPVKESVVVPTLESAAVPLPYRSCEEVNVD